MRWLNALVALLFLAGAWLTVHAYRAADSDADAQLREHDRRFQERAAQEVAEWGRQLQAPYAELTAEFADAHTFHTSGGTVRGSELRGLLVTSDGELRYSPVSAPRSPSQQDLHYYELGRSGGQSFEFEREDPGAALDAYTFFLPRIQDEELRARLTLEAGRAALKAGRSDLGYRLLASLVQERDPLFSDEGLPLDVAAVLTALALTDRDSQPARWQEWQRRKQRVLSRSAGYLETAWLQHHGGSAQAELCAARRRLEDFVARQPGALAEGWFLDGDQLTVSGATAGGVLVVDRVIPDLEAGRPGGWVAPASPFTDTPPGTVRVPVAPGPDVEPRFLELVDGQRATVLADLATGRRARQLQSVVLLVGITGASVLLWIVARRERRLAELRQRLLANVSHELKTPVTSLRMFAELIKERPQDIEKVARFATLMRAESVRLGRLIDNVLESSRAWRDEVRVEPRPVDLRPVLGSIAESFELLAAQQGVAFSVDVPAQDAATDTDTWQLDTDPEAVERITLNLLDNALKYRRATEPRIALSASRANGCVRITVADNGPGIALADRERIFEEFHRARYDDYGVQGSGLGLTISRRLARALGGDVTVASTPGEGSTFTLELPVGREEPS